MSRTSNPEAPEHGPVSRPKPRQGALTGYHARRRILSIEADRTQRAKTWRREF